MSRYTYNPRSLRAVKARFAARFAKPLASTSFFVSGGGLAGAVAMGFLGQPISISLTLGGLAAISLTLGIWLRRDVLTLPATPLESGTTALDALLPAEIVGGYSENMTAAELWLLLTKSWQVRFAVIRLGLPAGEAAAALGATALDPDALWDEATARARAAGQPTLTAPAILSALVHLIPVFGQLITTLKLTPADLDEATAWIGRIEAFQKAPNAVYGGLARDWAVGFTPLLNHFGQNISRQVELGGRRFANLERTNQLDALITSLGSATCSVALVGEEGIGKTALLYGLADRLLQGQAGSSLAHHQIIGLNAAILLSQQNQPGGLERLVLELFSEAARAGNIVLALDEAQLFFGQGTGAVNLSQVLLPVLQARSIKLVVALTPGEWQRLKATAPAMTNLMTPLVLTEPTPSETLRLLADRSLIIEGKSITTYAALQEAQRLSDRYYQEEADPGRSLKLLQAAMSYPDGQYVTAASVARAVEQQLGVKVQQATGAESDTLLHLEDRIHERMINQTRAVSVVAAALRRARAGVANPKRPVGSFLFLGPTGVGKTELARSLAAVYYGAENSMIRLDMSEYQRPEDVARLLADAGQNPDGLLPKVRQQPFSVVLFDEIEKAHPNILNLFLQLLDEGNLTDDAGKPTSFKDAIIIVTSNAGADEIRHHIEAGEELESFEKAFVDQLIGSGQFKPELLNRFDEIVLFRPLNQTELAQVVRLLIAEVNHTLEPQKIQVTLTDAAITTLVATGYDPRLGARPMRHMVQRQVEDAIASRILRGQAHPGDTIKLDVADINPAETHAVNPPIHPAA